MTPDGSALTPEGVLLRGGLLALAGFVIAGLVIGVGMRIRRNGGVGLGLGLATVAGFIVVGPLLAMWMDHQRANPADVETRPFTAYFRVEDIAQFVVVAVVLAVSAWGAKRR